MSTDRVQKILAQAGIASRRKAEELILEGLVTINGKLAKLGDKAEWGKDAIKVKGKLLLKPETKTYMAFNKPRLVISALSDPEDRPHLGEYLKKVRARVFPVGRLDFTSEGLILLTNDGDFAEKLQKRDDIPKVYAVKVKGHPTLEMISRIERGGRIGEGKSRPIKPHSVKIKQDLNNKCIVEVVVMGSGVFDIKTLFETRGFLVEKITRTAIGHITLKGIAPGQMKLLKASQVEALLEQPELGMKLLEQETARERWLVEKRLEQEEAEKNGTATIIRPRSSVQKRSNEKPSRQPRSGQKFSRQPTSGHKFSRQSNSDDRPFGKRESADRSWSRQRKSPRQHRS